VSTSTDGNRYTVVTAPAGFDGIANRRNSYFKTKRAAEEFRLRIKRWKAEQKSPTETLSFDDNDKRWLAYLRAHVGNLELLPEIVTHWEKTAKALSKKFSLSELVERFKEARKNQKPKLGKDTLAEDRFVTRRLLEVLGSGIEVHEVTSKLIQKAVDTGNSDSSRRKLFKVASLLFDFARSEKALLINPFDELERPQVRYVVPAIITPDQFAARLRLADSEFPELVPFLACSGLGGVRREELLKSFADDEVLQWSDFLWSKGLIEVRQEVAKKTKREIGDRRFIPIESALRYWLWPYQKASGPVVELSDSWFRKRMAKLLEQLHQNSQRNELRHSFCSYWLADKGRSIADLTKAAGNSEAVIRRHYLATLTPDESRAWFHIRRKRKKKVKPG
jgi:integrase